MELKPGYKQTEVGVIPEDWCTSKLQGITTSISSGKSNTKSKTGKFPIYGSTGIIGFQNYFDYEGDKVLVARVGANAGTVNRVTGKYCVSDNTLMISYQNNVDIRFACYQLINRNLNLLVFGSGQPLITGGQLKELVMTLPPTKAEQTAIANALSDADALIQSLTRLIAKKRQIKQGAMQTLLNPYENGRLKAGWVVKKLGDVAFVTKLAGFEYTNYFNSYKDEGEIIVVRGTNITKNKLDFSDVKTIPRITSNKLSRSKLFKGDLVFAYVGTIGPVCLIAENDRFHLGPNTCKISAEKSVTHSYLYIYFTSKFIQDEITEHTSIGAQPSLSMSKIRNFRIAYPLEITKQTHIATILSDMDAEITALETKLAKYRHIKQGMMQNLLTGRIRLVKPESNTGAVA